MATEMNRGEFLKSIAAAALAAVAIPGVGRAAGILPPGVTSPPAMDVAMDVAAPGAEETVTALWEAVWDKPGVTGDYHRGRCGPFVMILKGLWRNSDVMDQWGTHKWGQKPWEGPRSTRDGSALACIGCWKVIVMAVEGPCRGARVDSSAYDVEVDAAKKYAEDLANGMGRAAQHLIGKVK